MVARVVPYLELEMLNVAINMHIYYLKQEDWHRLPEY